MNTRVHLCSRLLLAWAGCELQRNVCMGCAEKEHQHWCAYVHGACAALHAAGMQLHGSIRSFNKVAVKVQTDYIAWCRVPVQVN